MTQKLHISNLNDFHFFTISPPSNLNGGPKKKNTLSPPSPNAALKIRFPTRKSIFDDSSMSCLSSMTLTTDTDTDHGCLTHLVIFCAHRPVQKHTTLAGTHTPLWQGLAYLSHRSAKGTYSRNTAPLSVCLSVGLFYFWAWRRGIRYDTVQHDTMRCETVFHCLVFLQTYVQL